MIMSGSKEATLLQIQLLDIHGTFYYDLLYTHTDESQPRRARVGKEDVYTDPRPGDIVQISYLMNVVTAVRRGG